jgi:hypothetical protein
MAHARDLEIRPLTIGEVIDRAVALTVRHFRTLFLSMLVLQLPAFATMRFLGAGLHETFTSLAANPARAPAGLPGLVGASLSIAGLLAFLQVCASAAAAAVVAPSLEGRPAPAAPWRALGRRTWPIASAAAAQLLAILLASALGALPGALLAWRAAGAATRLLGVAGALLGGALALLVAVLRFALGPAAAAVEGRAGASALWRSYRLMAPRPGLGLASRPGLRASILLLATFLIGVAANVLVGLPRAAASLALGRAAVSPLPVPLPVEIALVVFEAAGSAALQPFSLVALAVFYFDRRARLEGLDLELWADRLAVQRTRP